jgi:uncharacterized protein (DUF885 family)
MSQFERLTNEFLQAGWRHDPVEATRAGVHDHDRELPDKSPDAMQGWGQTLRAFQRRFEDSDPATLTHDEQLDRLWTLAVLDNAIATHELELWQRSPQIALQDVGTGLHSLLISKSVPIEAQFEALLARLNSIPAFLETALQNLDPVRIPPVWIDSSLPNAKATRNFIANEVPQAAAQVPALAQEIGQACARAAQATAEFEGRLRELRARAQGDFAIGRERFDRTLQKFHMLDMDSDTLYDFGLEWIDRYEQQLAEVAIEIDPGGNWVTALETIKEDYPVAAGLRQAYEDETMLARRYCLEKDLITFPEGESCVLEWTPVFMRARTPIAQPWVSPAFAPGLDSTWYITPIDPEASPERQLQHLRDNSWAWIRGIAMHEIYPGHHLQLVIAKQVATPLRLQFWSPVFGEGWGLYTEELFYEMGFLAEPRFRLMQLRNALWRAVRIIVDVGLHTRGMAVDEAARLLSERSQLEPRWAESEARYYTTRPTYPSSYQVGFAMLLDLRTAYQSMKGTDFSLKGFHDELMSYSSLPLRLVRQEMLA